MSTLQISDEQTQLILDKIKKVCERNGSHMIGDWQDKCLKELFEDVLDEVINGDRIFEFYNNDGFSDHYTKE